jgi:cytochrome c oxidase subunit II
VFAVRRIVTAASLAIIILFALIRFSLARAQTDRPLSYLHGFGAQAHSIVPLTWAVFVISIAVIVIITFLVLTGVLLHRARTVVLPGDKLPVERTGHGLRWIYIGVGISGMVLLGSLIWTVITLANINSPPSVPKLTIQITGQQWWWKVRYLNQDPSRIFTTANEIHIPTGEPVRVELISTDVIHSFWIPNLAGKTDAIPGQMNLMWLEADKPGRYQGQCTEYCGQQHAHMSMYVIAQSPQSFNAWYDAQLKAASPPSSPAVLRGERSFELHCGSCHRVRGTLAGGEVAPDLTHLMSRQTIAAGTLPNTIGYLSGWIADSQAIKPGNRMPVQYLSGPELEDIRTFLKTLK